MITIEQINRKEREQSHSFISFEQGPPYCELGWEQYQHFNSSINKFLDEFEKNHGKKVYIYEHEYLYIEYCYIWGVSFFEKNVEIREELTEKLRNGIYSLMHKIPTFVGRKIVNNHDADFWSDPYWLEFYLPLVNQAEHEVDMSYSQPDKKSYKKEDLDIETFKGELDIVEFKKLLGNHMKITSNDDLLYRHASDGFFSNKYRTNKYLREEFLPLLNFIHSREIADNAKIRLGIQDENYDAKITEEGEDNIIEITLGAPKYDYLYLSMTGRFNSNMIPLKTMAHMKKEIDSLPARIALSIDKKHDKKYEDGRLLLVVVQSEYTYQNEQYIIDEIIDEIRSLVVRGIGQFKEICLLFDTKLHSIF